MMATEIKEIRKAMAMSQGQFAKVLGVHPMTVSAWERDKKKPSRMAINFMRVLRRVPKLLDPDAD